MSFTYEGSKFFFLAIFVGTLKVTKTGEEVSEAVIQSHGFYDRINIDDEIVLVSLPEIPSQKDVANRAIDNVPVADQNGNALVKSEVKGEELIKDIKRTVEKPSILELLRNIY